MKRGLRCGAESELGSPAQPARPGSFSSALRYPPRRPGHAGGTRPHRIGPKPTRPHSCWGHPCAESSAAWPSPSRPTRTRAGCRPLPSGSATAAQMTKGSTPTLTWRWASGGWRLSTCPRAGTSRCGPRTAGTGWSTTARSTTTWSWARNCGSRAWRCARPRTPRCCWRCTPGSARTWCTDCAACSRSPSGTPGPGSCSAPGISSGSSRSTTRSTPSGLPRRTGPEAARRASQAGPAGPLSSPAGLAARMLSSRVGRGARRSRRRPGRAGRPSRPAGPVGRPTRRRGRAGRLSSPGGPVRRPSTRPGRAGRTSSLGGRAARPTPSSRPGPVRRLSSLGGRAGRLSSPGSGTWDRSSSRRGTHRRRTAGTRRLRAAGTRAARRPGLRRPGPRRPTRQRVAAAAGMPPGGASSPAGRRVLRRGCPVTARRGAGSGRLGLVRPGSPGTPRMRPRPPARAGCSGSPRNASAWPVPVS